VAGHRDPRQRGLRRPAQSAKPVSLGQVRPNRGPGRQIRHGVDRPDQHAAGLEPLAGRAWARSPHRTTTRTLGTSSIRSSADTRAYSPLSNLERAEHLPRVGQLLDQPRGLYPAAQDRRDTSARGRPRRRDHSGALASTIALQPDAAPPNNALNDLLFLQRMYDAGAAPYFDVMAMQAYGLWSGPTIAGCTLG